MDKIDELTWSGVFRHLADQHNTQGLGSHERVDVYISLAETADRVIELRQQKRAAAAATAALGAQHAGAVVGGARPQAFHAPAQPAPPAPAPQLVVQGVETPPGMKVVHVQGIGPVFVPEGQPDPNG